MNATEPIVAAAAVRFTRRRWPRRIGAALLGLMTLAVVGLLGLDTSFGHRLIVARVAALRPANGLRIRIGALDGSIWTRATLRDVALSDPRGRFLYAPRIELAWAPLAWIHHRLEVDRLAAPLVVLARPPAWRAGDGPALPGFDIRLGRLRIDRLHLGRAVAGTPQTLALVARATIRRGEAVAGFRLGSRAGDRIALDLDARPAANRFVLAGRLAAPPGGVVAGLVGTDRAMRVDLSGVGDWRGWHGRALGRLGAAPMVDLALEAVGGRYRLSGTLAAADLLHGKLQRLTAPRVRVTGEGRFAERQLVGWLGVATPAVRLRALGGLDLAHSAFRTVRIDGALIAPHALFPNMSGDVRVRLSLDGPFRAPVFAYRLASPHLAFDQTGFDGVRAAGAGRLGGSPVAIPLHLAAARVTGVGDVAGGILAHLRLDGLLKVDARAVIGDPLALVSDQLQGSLALRLNLASGMFDLGVAGGLRRYLIPGLGIVDVTTRATVTPGPAGQGAAAAGHAVVDVRRLDNALLRSLAGGEPHLDAGLRREPDGTLHFPGLLLTGPAVRIAGTGLRRRDGSFQFSGTGRQAQYGPFRLELDGMIDHPSVRLQLAAPVPALGLRDVALALDPVAGGYAFQASGRSTLGPFAAHGVIHTPPDRPTVIELADLAVSGTHAHGSLRSDPAGFTGTLDLVGAIAGSLGFAPVDSIQRIVPHLAFADASLALARPVGIGAGRLDGRILLDPAGTGLDLTFSGSRLVRGGLAVARGGAIVHLKDGRGTVALTAGGANTRAFALQATATLRPDDASLTVQGMVDGRAVALAAPARLTRSGDQWTLERARLTYAGGSITVAGNAGGAGLAADVTLDRLPLGLLDVVKPGLDLAGVASGHAIFAQPATGAASGRLDLALRGVSRAGLVASSQPADFALAAALTGSGVAARAVVTSGGRTVGRAQARVAPLGPDGLDHLFAAPLFAQLRYLGPAETPWRLLGVESLDLSGPLALGADIGGTLAHPVIRGTLRSDNARLESSVSGTVVTGLRASGRFTGATLVLDEMAGKVGAGTATGKGRIDLGHLASGVGLDLAIEARDAALLGRDDIAATVTGPVFIRSNGQGGTIGGQVEINRGRFRLGSAAAAQVAHLATTELNRHDEDGAPPAAAAPWRLDFHAHARNQLFVTGLGIDSEWKATLDVAGAVNDPAIAGRVDLVRGGYQFAGRRFELARGLIRFGGQAPPDPTLDITADADVTGFSAAIHVTGTGLHPEIAFQSTPSLPEDELVSRLLFGTSITNLSAPEALQLASAVASLRGGGGPLNLDPINAVRKIVRLDRLRILPADPTTGQKTAVAAGKYIGRRTYVELITDGQGYSATSVEFRITRWLSLLSTISTVGRQSANVKISKDY